MGAGEKAEPKRRKKERAIMKEGPENERESPS
jgi:hypothetical protein